MPNMGTCYCHTPGLWKSEAFRALLGQDGYRQMMEALQSEKKHRCYVSSEHLLKTLAAYVPQGVLKKHYKQKFLEHPEKFAEVCLVFDAGCEDGVKTLRTYEYDPTMALFASLTMPDADICCEWFVDGCGDYGSFVMRNGTVTEEKCGNVNEDVDRPNLPVSAEDRPEFIGEIIDLFEDFLEEKGVTLPSAEKAEAVDRGEFEEEFVAIIYGSDYDRLSDGLEEIIRRWKLSD